MISNTGHMISLHFICDVTIANYFKTSQVSLVVQGKSIGQVQITFASFKKLDLYKLVSDMNLTVKTLVAVSAREFDFPSSISFVVATYVT